MPLKNHKRKGTKNEYKSIKYLESMGFKCVRSAASLGPWDIVAIGHFGVLLVQVKSNGWETPAEREAMQEFSCPDTVHKQVHRWKDYSRLPEVRDVN